MSRAGRYRFAGGAALLATALLMLPTGRWALAVVDGVRDAGAAGIAVYALIYVVAPLLFLPASALTAGAGFLYGPLGGTLLVSPASVTAATIAFLLGRTVARDWVAQRVARDPRFAAIDRAIGRDGFRIVLLLRLSPLVPFNLLNYALGLTRVSVLPYIAASALGMLPGTVLYVYLGSLLTSTGQLVSDAPPAAPARQLLYWIGLPATLAVTVLLTRAARRALNEAVRP